ncbi:MATE family efflux transporter [Acetobacter sp. AN02]|uniref:MATE family efflux transporter n=1 Tax=Acetobacter sp. AN02 TaxID=2894186 RepID=UPI0024343CBF|nr:MATE family efflux transporter [Acetobacter sp. AN02]MDG6095336.1 MATE family efflux transporter [Acetobacter sp. AN02]
MTLTRKEVLDQAWPVILGQALVPLTGLTDVAVIGRTGDAGALAGVALGATIVNFVFWSFGFLRMGVTGMTAQAYGADRDSEVRATLIRALILGIPAGLIMLLVSPLIVPAALQMLSVPDDAWQAAHGFTAARFFGAPAALGFYALNGWFIGLGRTRMALLCQIVMNGANVILDLLLAGIFGLGAVGVGIGTALAEWVALGTACLLAVRICGLPLWRASLKNDRILSDTKALRRMVSVNADIMIRTLALLLLFAWFARSGARLGAVTAAASHVLMQFVNISAFVLDGFAFTAEQRTGAAIGAGSRKAFFRAARLTGEFSLIGGALFSLLFILCGPVLIGLLTTDEAVRKTALMLLPLCALVPLCGAPGWLLDGIFIGATRGRNLRNAALIVTGAYILTDFLLRGLDAEGVWTALLLAYLWRALALGCCLPGLIRDIPEKDEERSTVPGVVIKK